VTNTPPPNGTRRVCHIPDPGWGGFAMRDGVLMFEPHDDVSPAMAGVTVAWLRKHPTIFTEIPPQQKGTP